ncbi:MAG TPA: GNAT family N-acetyltransferase [Terrimicrobiaceae bacterium]
MALLGILNGRVSGLETQQSQTSLKLPLSKSTIRSFCPGDAVSITKHAGAYSVARNLLAVPHPYSLQNAEEWIAKATNCRPQTDFAIAIDDEVVGGIGIQVADSGRLAVSNHCAEIGYWLGETYWGRGIMSEGVLAMTEWAFAELRLVRLQAAVFARNPASARVLEKAGYEFEGRMRARYFRDNEFIDGLLYAKVRLPR